MASVKPDLVTFPTTQCHQYEYQITLLGEQRHKRVRTTCPESLHSCAPTSNLQALDRKSDAQPILCHHATRLSWLDINSDHFTCIMPTSFAPSPTASVTALRSWRRTRDTSSAFCSGDMRQQMTAFDDNSSSSRSRRQSYIRPYLSVCNTIMCFSYRRDKTSKLFITDQTSLMASFPGQPGYVAWER